MNIDDLVDSFNGDKYDEDIQPYFNDITNFLRYANKYGFINDLDLYFIPNDEFEDVLPYLE